MHTFAVLGATGTIGSEICSRLVQAGNRVIMLARSQEKLVAAADRLGPQAIAGHVQDFASSDVLRGSIEPLLDGQPLTGIVNCIGSILLKPAHGTSDQEFRDTIETNLFTSFAVVRTAGLLMRRGGGSVVLMASAAAEIGLANHEAIAAAKAGIIGLARSAAATYANNNIRVNVVSPGLTCTELTRRIWENATNAAASAEMHALGRLGQPQHIASAVTWLLDPQNDWITGDVLHVDGGLANIQPRKRM